MDEIKEKITELRKLYLLLENELLTNKDPKIQKKYEETIKKYYVLREQYEELEAIEFAKNNKVDITDGEIDLYLQEYKIDNCGRNYKIFLHNTLDYVGKTSYYGKNGFFSLQGNVSCEIKKEFRGNGYALKSLKLLTDKVYEEGIDKVYISAYENNYPSLKTIEKFGGVLVEKYKNICRYECDLNKIKGIKFKSGKHK